MGRYSALVMRSVECDRCGREDQPVIPMPWAREDTGEHEMLCEPCLKAYTEVYLRWLKQINHRLYGSSGTRYGLRLLKQYEKLQAQAKLGGEDSPKPGE